MNRALVASIGVVCSLCGVSLETSIASTVSTRHGAIEIDGGHLKSNVRIGQSPDDPSDVLIRDRAGIESTSSPCELMADGREAGSLVRCPARSLDGIVVRQGDGSDTVVIVTAQSVGGFGPLRRGLRVAVDSGGGRDRVRTGAGSDLIVGGPGRDTLVGLEGADRILGSGGADELRGGSGRDSLNGGLGRDIVRGGRDHDRCVTSDRPDVSRSCRNLDGRAGDDLPRRAFAT